MEWIKCSEKMPEKLRAEKIDRFYPVQVMFFYPNSRHGDIMIGYFDDLDQCWYSGQFTGRDWDPDNGNELPIPKEKVTHWMPMISRPAGFINYNPNQTLKG